MIKKRAIVFVNGNLSDIRGAKEKIGKNDCIICVDGAAEKVIELGIIPNIIIGDLDSLPPKSIKRLRKYTIEWIRFPIEKDKTDFELAMELAFERKFSEIIIYGILGNRLDHLFGNIFFISKMEILKKNIHVTMVENNQTGYFVREKIHIHGNKGDLLSILPITKTIAGVSSAGLKYPLHQESLRFGGTRGISNVLTSSEAVITIRKGVALILHAKT